MSKRDDLPQDVRIFLETSIDSIEQLQVLLLLFSKPERQWTIAEITTELRSATSSIEKRIQDLYGRNILVKSADSFHKYRSTSPEVQALIAGVAEHNHLRPYQVIDAIYSTSSKSIQAFADSFKVRGEKL